MRVGEALAEPLEIHRLESGDARQERVEELLRWTGLAADDAARFLHELSGGQRQRVAIARALASRPKLLVADEPVSSLDVSVQAQIVNLLVDLQRRLGLSLLLIAHDLALVEQIADRVAVMYFGRIVELGPTERVLGAPQHPYTVALLNAAPSVSGSLRTGAAMGEPPSHLSPPPGCAFGPRCEIARPTCSSDAPALIDLGDGHRVACHYSGELNPGGCAGVSTMEQSAGESVV